MVSISRKLRCFVAMAFGYEDTDHLYDQWVKPAIEEADLIPIRVDRIIHNDRIDARIRDELIKADVVMADLTYARPSVYWEAGFAERSVPVIYTCRKDHFSPLPDDNLRNHHKVHFDLANANIATWFGRGNKSFKNDLLKRLRFVTADLRRQREYELELKEKRLAFAQKSLSEKMDDISSASITALLDVKYRRVRITRNEKDPTSPNQQLEKELQSNLFWKTIGSTGILISAHYCYSKFVPESLTSLYGSYILSSIRYDSHASINLLPSSIKRNTKIKINKIRQIKFIPVLSRVSDQRIQNAFPYWKNIGLEGCYFSPNIFQKKQ